eukprot:1447531-Pyramimonas_sp.AAC.1
MPRARRSSSLGATRGRAAMAPPRSCWRPAATPSTNPWRPSSRTSSTASAGQPPGQAGACRTYTRRRGRARSATSPAGLSSRTTRPKASSSSSVAS